MTTHRNASAAWWPTDSARERAIEDAHERLQVQAMLRRQTRAPHPQWVEPIFRRDVAEVLTDIAKALAGGDVPLAERIAYTYLSAEERRHLPAPLFDLFDSQED